MPVNNPPNTTDPLWIGNDRREVDQLALEVYGPLARSLGYMVRVRPTHKTGGVFGIFLVDRDSSEG